MGYDVNRVLGVDFRGDSFMSLSSPGIPRLAREERAAGTGEIREGTCQKTDKVSHLF